MSETLGFDPTSEAAIGEISVVSKRGDYSNVTPLSKEETRLGNMTVEKISYRTLINFSEIAVQEERPVEVVLKVRSDDGNEYTINDSLPPEVVIVEVNTGEPKAIQSNKKGKYIEIPRVVFMDKDNPRLEDYAVGEGEAIPKPYDRVSFRFLDSPNALVMIEHEVGHTRHPTEDVGARNAIEHRVERLINGGGIITDLTEEELAQYQDLVVKDEREAWNFALHEIRRVREMGVDLTAGQGTGAVLHLADRSSKTYSYGHLPLQHPGSVTP